MAELSTLARPYAKAAFEYARDNNALPEWQAQLATAAAVTLDPAMDRAMLCGSPGMLHDMRELLDGLNFEASPQQGVRGDYVFERAFVD